MPKLYACIISADAKRDKAALVTVADRFAYSIEVIEDGVLFDVSGLERLIGKPDLVAQKILAEIKKFNIRASIGVAETSHTAMLLARQNGEEAEGVHLPDTFGQLPLKDLGLERDTLNVFSDLGIRCVEDLLAIPRDALVERYGREFENVIDMIEQRGVSFIKSNVKEDRATWSFELDHAVENFEQLIFVLNHGLERLLAQTQHYGFSCEHLDLMFRLKNKTKKGYEIKTSFPILDRNFWLKLINLRVSLDPPEAEIVSVNVVFHFTKPRPAQRGLYAVSRPEPESLLLTVNKLKKLAGEENVGVPVLLNQRLAEPFALDADAVPDVRNESAPASSRLGRIAVRRSCASPSAALLVPAATPPHRTTEPYMRPIIAFTYSHPPVRAEVLVRDGRLVFVKTSYFSGHIVNYSGVWRTNSKWWDKPWKTQEWDIEVDNNGVYRLCKVDKEWFLAGEYD
jgi:protein ImuB